jgi:lipopolysaccharide/colanic/teichoic acid biosynthesis glycosyltransferase
MPVPAKVSVIPCLVPARYFHWKGRMDRVLAAILLVPGLPIIGLLMLLVRCTSRGPGIYRQTRTGKDGRTFTLYKLRTMRQDAEAATGAVWSVKNDPRVAPLGRVLRKLHLDELPQLFNVLRGEMSLVGPRPERPEFVHVLAEQIPRYGDRLTVLPGVTGLAQVNLPPDTDLDSVRRKLELDLEYCRRANLFLDLRIMACTSLRIFGISARFTRFLLGVERHPRFNGANGRRAGGGTEPAELEEFLSNPGGESPPRPPDPKGRGRPGSDIHRQGRPGRKPR